MPTPFPTADAPLQALTRVYNGDVDGIALRFYAAPGGKPDMPWIPFSDVAKIGCPAPGTVRAFIARIDNHVAFGHEGTAKVAIIPYWLAAELVKSAIAGGTCERSRGRELHAEADIALNRAAQLQPTGQQAAYRDAARVLLRQQLGDE